MSECAFERAGRAGSARRHPRAPLRYARTAMRNKSGAGCRGARAKRARNDSPHALRYATRTTMRMKGEHHEIPYATPKRGVPSWSACDSGAEREHPRAPLRSAHYHAARLGRSVPLALPSAPIHAARPRSPPRERRRPIWGRVPLMGVGGAFGIPSVGGV